MSSVTMILNEADLAVGLAETARNVFSMMMGVDGIETDAHCRLDPPQCGVLAVLGLSGTCTGTGMFWCSPESACKLAGQMLMSEYETPSDEVLDAVGEIANMIIGNVKSDLENLVGPLGLGTPTVICGAEFRTRQPSPHVWVTVGLRSDECLFVAGLSFSPNQVQ